MKNLIIFTKTQLKFLVFIFFITVLPYLALCMYAPKIPYMHYFFILIIFLIKLLTMDEGKFQKKIKPQAELSLKAELGKNPSRDQIFNRIQFISLGRNICLLLAGVFVIFLAIIFGRL